MFGPDLHLRKFTMKNKTSDKHDEEIEINLICS